MPTDFSKRPLGHVPSKRDPRDWQHPRYASAGAAVTLPSAYMVPYQPPMRDQKQYPACVGYALAALLGQACLSRGIVRVLSAMAGYVGARSRENPPPDEGTSIRDALVYAQQHGIEPEADTPDTAGIPSGPNLKAAADAFLTKASGFAEVNTQGPTWVEDIKYALMSGQANLIVALDVTPGFDSPGADGVMTPGGDDRGSHAVNIVGWDNLKGFRVRNSWGEGWAQHGYAWRPFTMVYTEAYKVSVAAIDHLPAPSPWWAPIARLFGWK